MDRRYRSRFRRLPEGPSAAEGVRFGPSLRAQADDQDRDRHDWSHHLEPRLSEFERADGPIHASPPLETLGREESNSDVDLVLWDDLVGFARDVETSEGPRNRLGMIEGDLDPDSSLKEVHLPSSERLFVRGEQSRLHNPSR